MDIAIGLTVWIVGLIIRFVVWLGSFIVGFAIGKSASGFRGDTTRVTIPDTLEYPQDISPPSPQRARGFLPLLTLIGGCSLCYGLWFVYTEVFAVIGIAILAAAVILKLTLDSELQRPQTIDPLDLSGAQVYTIRLPRATEWNSDHAYQFMNQMLLTFDRLIFRIVAQPGQIVWQIVDTRLHAAPDTVVRSIRAAYPDAEISVSPLTIAPFTTPFYRTTLLFQHANPFPAPIAYVGDLRDFDPLVALTQAMSDLQAGEQVIYTLMVCGGVPWAGAVGAELVSQWDIHPFAYIARSGMNALAGRNDWVRTPERVERFVPDQQRLMERKLGNPLYAALVLLQIDAPSPERITALLPAASHLMQFHRAPLNSLLLYEDGRELITFVDNPTINTRSDTFGLLKAWISNQNMTWKAVQLVLEPMELAALWHLPNNGFHAPTIAWTHGKSVHLPASLVGKQAGVCLGDNVVAGRREPVYISDPDRATHLTIIGKTGTGKSTLLHHLIHQDILRGQGVAVIDPHGNLVRNILRTSIGRERKDEVVVLDVANDAYPPPLNPLAVAKGVEPMTTAGQLVALIERVTGRLSDTPRVADTLTMALVTLWQADQPTLLDVDRVFDDLPYRQRLVATANNIAVTRFWDKFDLQSDAQKEQLTYPVIYRMRSFYGNPALLPIMCHPDTLDFAALMRAHKIILVSLAADEKKIPPREQELLGATLVSAFQSSLTAGQNTSPPFTLYIDEAQRFVTTSLPTLFESARKRGLTLMLANQYFKQLAGDTLDAVMGNVGAIIAFQCGIEDARSLAPYMKPSFDSEALVNLDKYQAAVWMRDDGQTLPAFSLATRPPFVPSDPHMAVKGEQYLRQLSITHHTRKSRADVLQWISNRYTSSNGQPADDDLYDPQH